MIRKIEQTIYRYRHQPPVNSPFTIEKILLSHFSGTSDTLENFVLLAPRSFVQFIFAPSIPCLTSPPSSLQPQLCPRGPFRSLLRRTKCSSSFTFRSSNGSMTSRLSTTSATPWYFREDNIRRLIRTLSVVDQGIGLAELIGRIWKPYIRHRYLHWTQSLYRQLPTM